MAHLATKRFNYWSQLGVLAAFCGTGLILGGVLSLIPMFGKLDFEGLKGSSTAATLDKILKPENAGILRWMQFITTLFLFFIPPVLYALLCHKKPFVHLVFHKGVNIQQILLIIFIMAAALPVVSLLQEITEMFPWKQSTLLKFKAAEDAYNKEVAVMARMNDFTDYVISVLIIAFLPAVFEETLFRGGVQNLFSRWFKSPILAIVVTSIIFSAIHGSYLGFLSRFALSFILGWMFYRTGNLWLSIIAHFCNNAFAVTMLYLSRGKDQKVDPSNLDERFPIWIGLLGLVVLFALFLLFEKINRKDIDRPGEEVLIPYSDFSNNPFENDLRVNNDSPTTLN